MTRVEKIRWHIDQAMRNRYARVAILVDENFSNTLDLIDQQPAAVIEVMIEHGRQLQLPKHRHRVRDAIIEYLEERLDQARTWERQLAEAITGMDNLPDE